MHIHWEDGLNGKSGGLRAALFLVLVWVVFQLGATVMEARHGRTSLRSVPPPSVKEVESVLSSWPARSRDVAQKIISECGLPDRVNEKLLRWDQNGIVMVCGEPDSLEESATAALFSRGRAAAPRRSRGKLPREGS